MFSPAAYAATTAAGNFSLDVSPSPLVATVKPGQTSDLILKIHNSGSQTQDLKIEARSFLFNSSNGQIKLEDNTPPSIVSWLSFSQPTFSIDPNQWFNESIHIVVPKDAGFSYSFALVVSRQNEPAPAAGGLIKGSVAVFSLINIDRPGAVRKLAVTSFAS